MNQDKMPVSYYTSEIKPADIKTRLAELGVDQANCKINFYQYKDELSCHDNGGLVVVDYIEPPAANPYGVKDMMKYLHDRAGKSIVLTAVQVTSTTGLPEGGASAFHKADLCVIMKTDKEPHVAWAQVWDVKRPPDEENSVKNMICKYRVSKKGSTISMITSWFTKN